MKCTISSPHKSAVFLIKTSHIRWHAPSRQTISSLTCPVLDDCNYSVWSPHTPSSCPMPGTSPSLADIPPWPRYCPRPWFITSFATACLTLEGVTYSFGWAFFCGLHADRIFVNVGNAANDVAVLVFSELCDHGYG